MQREIGDGSYFLTYWLNSEGDWDAASDLPNFLFIGKSRRLPAGIGGGVAGMGRIGPRRNRREVAGPAAGPALLAQEAWLMSVSFANWQMRTKPKELGRPDGPHA